MLLVKTRKLLPGIHGRHFQKIFGSTTKRDFHSGLRVHIPLMRIRIQLDPDPTLNPDSDPAFQSNRIRIQLPKVMRKMRIHTDPDPQLCCLMK
jgi:hypothetical protein